MSCISKLKYESALMAIAFPSNALEWASREGKKTRSFTEKKSAFCYTNDHSKQLHRSFQGSFWCTWRKQKVKNRPMLGKSITHLLISTECKITANA